MSATVTFTIDGKEVTALADQTIVQAASRAGIYIPTLCHLPGVISPGACRICTVRINGRYAAACKTPVQEGARIENDTPELLELRKTLVEAIFVEGNHFCPACEKSGNCDLQALAYRFRILAPRFEYAFPRRQIEARPKRLMLERNRCILCKRCVNALKNDKGESVFTLSGRGRSATVNIDLGKADALDDEFARRAMDTCPVGSILRKGAGFCAPIGTRKYDKAAIGSDVRDQGPVGEKA